jgi:hypothetical protein
MKEMSMWGMEYKVYIYMLLHESLLVDKRMGAEVRVVMVVVVVVCNKA